MNVRNPLYAFAFFLTILSSSAFSEMTGLELYKQCQAVIDQLSGKELTSEQGFQVIFITGYVAGFVDFHSIQQMNCTDCKWDYCFPSNGVSNDEIIKAIYSYIEEKPKAVELSARMLILAALMNKYPCKKKSDNSK